MASSSFSITRDILRFEGGGDRSYWQRFAMLLSLATVIATMGLLRDSGAVIIAAMLVAPLMTPILGIAAAIVMGWVGRAGWLLLIVWSAAAASVGIAWLIVFLSDVPRGILLPHEVLSRTDPGAEDLVIALAAGIAGAYVQINRSEASLLPGAAIGVSLVPPLSAAGILLYFGQYHAATEAVLLFATNFGAIIFSACIVYLASGAARALIRSERRRLRFGFGIGATVAFLAAVFLPLFSATLFRYAETGTETALAEAAAKWAGPVSLEILRVDVDAEAKTAEIWAVVDLPAEAQDRLATAAELLPRRLRDTPFRQVALDVLGRDYTVVIRYQTRFAWLVDLGTETIAPAPEVTPVPAG
ncbi:DUF389 domain-containing protein [Poseidonocella sp. HB161398]|uniref:DUF389 domain-containing protein n=1 Tax=Poseidonocella sp. HB161398 TaxID=2320855 RepID=UPI001107CAC1|nr:DUF389 domain-containing protein [Poseidonocella sp. HB161398]